MKGGEIDRAQYQTTLDLKILNRLKLIAHRLQARIVPVEVNGD